MAESTHQALVYEINPVKIENSDFLSKTKVDDYMCVIRTEDWVGRTKGVFLQPDSLVDITRPEFSHMASEGKYSADSTKGVQYARIKAKKFRGQQSFGMLTPVPNDTPLGENWAEKLGVLHYEPPMQSSGKGGFMTSGEIVSAPMMHGSLPKYDVEAGRKYARKIFVENERCVITLKYHGCNGSWVYSDGEFHCRSRTEFKKEFATPPKVNLEELIAKLGEEKAKEVAAKIEAKAQNPNLNRNLWWRVLRENEELQKFCQDNPDTVVWGEVIGVQGIKFLYGLQPGQVSYRVFDIYKDGRFLDFQDARDLAKDLKWVHVIDDNFPIQMDKLIELVENMPLYANTTGIEEGLCIKPYKERYNDCIGRTHVKFINPVYLEKS